MDPDEILNELRELLYTSVDQTALHMSELFDNLDLWLSSGGFLPHDWKVRGSGCQ